MQQPQPLDKEVLFDGGIMITETDLRGKITYVNRKFIEMSAYDKKELIGAPHSIMRHPDMPQSCFKSMWDTLKKGDTWKGYVKNLRKDGAYYWVVVYVSPKYDDEGNHIGYIAARKVPEENSLQAIKRKYDELKICEAENGDHPANAFGNIMGEEMPEVI